MEPPKKGNVIYLSEWFKDQPWSHFKRKAREIVRYQLGCYHADAIAKQNAEAEMRSKIVKEMNELAIGGPLLKK